MDRMDDAKETLFFAHGYMSELGKAIDELNRIKLTDKKVMEYMQTFFPDTAELSDIQRKNNRKLLEDMKRRYFDAPDLKHMGKNAYRFINAVLDTLKEIYKESQDVGEEALVITTQTGHPQTATNLEHRAAIVFKNAGLEDYSGELHIFRRTFATRMYESGARTADIAAYIGDLESTTAQYYIAKRKKYVDSEGKERQIVDLPARK